jgi:hypothetical protein
MSDIAAGANLDWSWIEFVGLWLLSPLVVIVGSLTLLHHRRGRILHQVGAVE